MPEGLKGFLEAITSTTPVITQADSLPPPLNYKHDYPRALEWMRGLVGYKSGAYDIVSALKVIGVTPVFEDMGQDNSISGYIERLQSSWRIAVNRYEISGRQRFTLAHELAHLLFHRELIERRTGPGTAGRFAEAIKLFRSKDDYRHEEMEANAFAAELLMPSVEFRGVWRNTSSVRRVSQYFDVSLYAAEYRAKKLKLASKDL